MQEFWDWLTSFLAVIFVPATAYGAAGAALRCIRAGVGKRQLIIEMLCGAVVSNAVMPIIADYAPESWHYTLFFFVGVGGMESVSRFYEAVASAIEKRIKSRISGD